MTKTMTQVLLRRHGGPEELKPVETRIPEPGPGEVLIKVEAIGVNYSDTLRRRDLYFQPTPLPYVPGSEAVGKIVALGDAVSHPYETGLTVLAILPNGGGYSEFVTAQAQYCVPLPPEMSPKTATGIFVQGTTAQLLTSQVAKELKGKTVLINAAAGGVGSLLVQLAKLNGAKVIAASSSDSKLKLASDLGADAIVNYSINNWSEQVKEYTDGKGVDIAFEMVGGEVYNQTVKSMRQGGHLILYGCASGVQGHVHPEHFVDENLSQSGFNLAHYITMKPHLWQEALGTIIGLISLGNVTINTSKTFALEDAADAHRQMESRLTTGKIVLTVKK